MRVLAVLLGLVLIGNVSAQRVSFSMVYAGGDPLFKELVHRAVGDFLRTHPGVSIDESPSTVGSSYLDFLLARDAANQFPDLVEMRDTPVFQRAGKLAPLPDEVSSLVANPVRFGGKIYSLSLVAQAPLGAIYNAKFFRENKLVVPRTYDEFLRLLDSIKARGVTPIVVGGKDLWHMAYWFMKFYLDEVAAQNPNFIADRYAGKVHFSDAPMRQALVRWADLFSAKHGWVDPVFFTVADNQTAETLTSGRAVLLYSGTWMLQQIAALDPSFEIGWFPVPSSADDRIHLVGGSTAQGWAMSAEASKDPAKSRAILEFIKFFFRKDNYESFLRQLNGIPTTVERISYRSETPVMAEILETYQKTNNKQLIWNQNLGVNELPPGFRDYAYLQIMEFLVGGKDLDATTNALDVQWETLTKAFNPTKVP